MNTHNIVAELKAEIRRLQQAVNALDSVAGHSTSSRVQPKRRNISAAGRKRIAAAQKARWAIVRAAKKSTK
jgi:hypothetical protein